MAAVDKCYINSWEEYKEFKDWCKDRYFYTPLGEKVVLDEFLYEWHEESFKNGEERPIFNTPIYVDNYLYHYCNIDFIHKWLQSRYFTDGYRKGDPEDVMREMELKEYVPCTKVKVIRKGLGNCPYKGFWWVKVIDTDGMPMMYNKKYDQWIFQNDLEEWDSSDYVGKCTAKAIIRKVLKKWKLPKGCTVRLSGRYIGDKWIMITK